MKFTPNLTKTEWKHGLIAMTVAMFLLPGLIAYIPGLSGARLNFAAHFISAGTAVYCLRRFLGKNITAALDRPFSTLYLAVLGYLAHLVFAEMADFIAWTLLPGYVNLNTQTVQTQLSADLPLMLATTVVLAPIGEECFFRGLLFRGIYDRSPILAWSLSVGLFAASHVVGYLGLYSPLALAISFVQYLPAGIVLCITYQTTGTIMGPMLTHAIINFMAVYATTR